MNTEQKDFIVVITLCVVIIALFAMLLAAMIKSERDPVTLYDISVRLHYVDGYSEVISVDSIPEWDLPEIKEGLVTQGVPGKGGSTIRIGTYSMYVGNKCYHGVIRFEYVRKRKYDVSPQTYRNLRNRH